MRRYVLAALAAATLVAPAPVVATTAVRVHVLHEVSVGGCGFLAVRDDTGTYAPKGTWAGVVWMAYVQPVGTSSFGPAWCDLVINGVDDTMLGPSGSVHGVVLVDADLLAFTAGDTDSVQMCDNLVVNNTLTQRCDDAVAAQVPPESVNDILFDTLQPVDAAACPYLASTSPGLPGVIDVDPSGDVRVEGNRLWDCPPYFD